MSVRIVIKAGGDFEDAQALVSDLVFWKNDDSKPHTPCGLNVDPGETSSALQPIGTGTNPFSYKCTKHDDEIGFIFLYNDFVTTNKTVTTPTPPTDPIPVATGGKSPYTMSAAEITPSGVSVTLVETSPAGSNAGISAILGNPPSGFFIVTFNLTAADSLGNNIDQQTVTITYSDFVTTNKTVAAPTPPTDPIPVATGGKSPYTMSAADITPSGVSITFVETSPAGISAILGNPPSGSFTVTFKLTAADSLGHEIDKQTVTITYNA